jgi:hypothetical protein
MSNEELMRELAELEQKYGMPSVEFYAQFRSGALSCSNLEFTDWAGLCYIATRLGLMETS